VTLRTKGQSHLRELVWSVEIHLSTEDRAGNVGWELNRMALTARDRDVRRATRLVPQPDSVNILLATCTNGLPTLSRENFCFLVASSFFWNVRVSRRRVNAGFGLLICARQRHDFIFFVRSALNVRQPDKL
jgi:hypothetical protein